MAQTGCARCSSDTPPDELVISSNCGHTFCVECVLYLWSCQKDGAPCICPFDRKTVSWIRPSSINVPEKIHSIVNVYNRLFDPVSAKARGSGKLGYAVNLSILVGGLVALAAKIYRDGR